jgi:hypothetical protein
MGSWRRGRRRGWRQYLRSALLLLGPARLGCWPRRAVPPMRRGAPPHRKGVGVAAARSRINETPQRHRASCEPKRVAARYGASRAFAARVVSGSIPRFAGLVSVGVQQVGCSAEVYKVKLRTRVLRRGLRSCTGRDAPPRSLFADSYELRDSAESPGRLQLGSYS